MNRTEFEALRDLQGKRITHDIRFGRRAALQPALEVDKVEIANAAGTDLRMNMHYNPETGSKTINVYIPGTGPICRLDVDGTKHGDAGRTHKHSLQADRCPDRNLPEGVVARPDLSGLTMKQVFDEFCRMASIDFEGTFFPPEEAS
jgi:hypothetical protein